MFELLLGTSVINSWIVFNMVSQTKLGIMQFRRQLAKELIYQPVEDREQPTPMQTAPTRKRPHTFIKPEGPGRKKRKPCTGY